MGKKSLIDILAGLDDDEAKVAFEESRRTRKLGKMSGMVFDFGDEEGEEGEEGEKKKPAKKGFFDS